MISPRSFSDAAPMSPVLNATQASPSSHVSRCNHADERRQIAIVDRAADSAP